MYLTAKVLKYFLLFSFFWYNFSVEENVMQKYCINCLFVVKAESCRAVGISEIVIVFLVYTPNSEETEVLCS